MTENTLSPAAGIGGTVAVIALMAIAVFTFRPDAKTRAADAAFSQALSVQIDVANARANARREAWIQIIKQARKQARDR